MATKVIFPAESTLSAWGTLIAREEFPLKQSGMVYTIVPVEISECSASIATTPECAGVWF